MDLRGGLLSLPRVVLVCCALVLASVSARAQVFSPGALSKAHRELDGLVGCTKCHPEGGKLDNGKCLDCHKEIGRRIDAGKGYHDTVKAKDCAECHREHRGLKADIIEWQPSRDLFNHRLTGWSLEGAHKKPKCQECHEPRRVVDPEIQALITKENRDSYLGLGTRCVLCHFDEHRGQEGNDCARCHTTEDFKKSPGFNHNDRNDAKFPLQGKHAKVNCKECHEVLLDPKKADVFPEQKNEYYLQLKDIPHASCVECHEDFHKGSFGKNCVKCHTPEGWRIIKEGAKDTAFHDQHAFKLRGSHMSVDCKQCHGPYPGVPVKFKGIKFKNCVDCHVDAHVGQVQITDGIVKCDSCHNVNGFAPVSFDVARHNKETRFVLEASHQTVACNMCHGRDPKLTSKIPRSVSAALVKQKRAVVVSDTVLSIPSAFTPAGEPTRCESCHADDDPHGGQFINATRALEDAGLEVRGCASCHSTKTFTDLRFTHDQSRFPLTGKHADVWCNSCHFESQLKGRMKGVVQYRPLPFACQTCHADAHVGQLAMPDGVTDCATCHATTSFKDVTFDHNKQSTFALDGAHVKADCASCHPGVSVGEVTIARYKPVPSACVDCHEDEHKGGFDAFNPNIAADVSAVSPVSPVMTHSTVSSSTDSGALLDAGVPLDAGITAELLDAGIAHSPSSAKTDAKSAKTDAKTAKAGDVPDAGVLAASDEQPLLGTASGVAAAATFAQPPSATVATAATGCNGCHVTDGWWPATFAHDRTSFPLTGRHQGAACNGCHGTDYDRSTSTSCATCHRDVHVQEFGTQCQACHTTERFTGPEFPVDAHRRLNFPLNGRHAALPCDECHTEKRDRTFMRAAVDCASCHARDARAATQVTVNHQRRPFNTSCRDCHSPVSFLPATFAQHDACWPITRGVHAVVSCNTCHSAVRGATFDGDCAGVPVRCAECHTHNRRDEAKRHEDVPGYGHDSEKCITCHKAG